MTDMDKYMLIYEVIFKLSFIIATMGNLDKK
jgi:hypothetical protein